MHVLEILAACAAALVLIGILAILARQRFMLRAPGAIPAAYRARTPRWQYGVARFVAGELRWYRSLGLGTRPNRVMRRGDLVVLGRRSPNAAESGALPPRAVIVEVRDNTGDVAFAFSEGAYTGFVSWLESAPAS